MKVLHVLDHSVPIQSGYSFRSLAIINGQRKLGWSTCHMTGFRQDEATDKSTNASGLHFYRTDTAPWQSIPLLNYLGLVYAQKKQIEHAISIEKPDVIHAHSPALNALAAFWATRSTAIPVVYEIRAFWEDAGVDHGTTKDRGIRYRLIRHLETWVMRQAAAVTTICNGLRLDILGRGIPQEKVTVIPNAIDPAQFPFAKQPNTTIKKDLGIEGSPTLGFIGSFYAYEGLELLLQSMPKVIAANPSVKLLLIGGEEQEVALKKLSTRLGLNDHVIFVGRVPHDEVNEYYSVIDILVYPRLSIRLTEIVTPLKPLEAMALGKNIILSDIGGHQEIAEELLPELSFKAGDVESLSERINTGLSNLDQESGFATKARAYVESQRSWDNIIPRYRQVFANVLRRAV